MILKNDIGLIGDFIGTIPVMIALAKIEPLEVIIPSEVNELFNMIPGEYKIKRSWRIDKFDRELNLTAAWNVSVDKGYHMTQAYFDLLGMDVPSGPVRPELEYRAWAGTAVHDYILAPFSRSLPKEQMWQQQKWQDLVDEMPESKFAILTGPNNPKDYIDPDTNNLTVIYNRQWDYVAYAMRMCIGGLISVVSGPSHLAYAVNAKNFLLTNQKEAWGNNPDAIKITKNIHDIAVEDVIKILKENDR